MLLLLCLLALAVVGLMAVAVAVAYVQGSLQGQQEVWPLLFYRESALNTRIITRCGLRQRAFRPVRWLQSAHVQTLMAALLPRVDGSHELTFQREYLQMRDKGVVALDWVTSVTPPRMRRKGSVLLVLPQVTGDAFTVAPLCGLAARRGFKVVVFNRRGHGGSVLTTPKLLNTCDPSDLRQVIKYLRLRYPKSRLAAVAHGSGCSLLISYLGEFGSSALLSAGACVSPCYDSAQRLAGGPLRSVYDLVQLLTLKAVVLRHAAALAPVLDVRRALLTCWTFRRFEEEVFYVLYARGSGGGGLGGSAAPQKEKERSGHPPASLPDPDPAAASAISSSSSPLSSSSLSTSAAVVARTAARPMPTKSRQPCVIDTICCLPTSSACRHEPNSYSDVTDDVRRRSSSTSRIFVKSSASSPLADDAKTSEISSSSSFSASSQNSRVDVVGSRARLRCSSAGHAEATRHVCFRTDQVRPCKGLQKSGGWPGYSQACLPSASAAPATRPPPLRPSPLSWPGPVPLSRGRVSSDGQPSEETQRTDRQSSTLTQPTDRQSSTLTQPTDRQSSTLTQPTDRVAALVSSSKTSATAHLPSSDSPLSRNEASSDTVLRHTSHVAASSDVRLFHDAATEHPSVVWPNCHENANGYVGLRDPCSQQGKNGSESKPSRDAGAAVMSRALLECADSPSVSSRADLLPSHVATTDSLSESHSSSQATRESQTSLRPRLTSHLTRNLSPKRAQLSAARTAASLSSSSSSSSPSSSSFPSLSPSSSRECGVNFTDRGSTVEAKEKQTLLIRSCGSGTYSRTPSTRPVSANVTAPTVNTVTVFSSTKAISTASLSSASSRSGKPLAPSQDPATAIGTTLPVTTAATASSASWVIKEASAVKPIVPVIVTAANSGDTSSAGARTEPSGANSTAPATTTSTASRPAAVASATTNPVTRAAPAVATTATRVTPVAAATAATSATTSTTTTSTTSTTAAASVSTTATEAASSNIAAAVARSAAAAAAPTAADAAVLTPTAVSCANLAAVEASTTATTAASLSASGSLSQHSTAGSGSPATAEDYWERQNPLRDVDDIAVPVLCVNGLDDPVYDSRHLPYDLFRCYPNFLLVATPRGGHCAFLEGLPPRSWADPLCLDYLEAVWECTSTSTSASAASSSSTATARGLCATVGGSHGSALRRNTRSTI